MLSRLVGTQHEAAHKLHTERSRSVTMNQTLYPNLLSGYQILILNMNRLSIYNISIKEELKFLIQSLTINFIRG